LLKYLTLVIVRLAKEYFETNGRVLDVGCGIGRTSRALVKEKFVVTGIDSSKKAIKIAKKYY
jgi:2-polyprenyl-3-methyl-5-hydroxy-6-metoxy-1,4-benzoquinol methylase